ncbi:MAG TPA: hypothetical protein VNT55_01325, partial [Baekduia sp.]|nr:hypothetical protein [Baekduia sp.]
KTPPAPLAFSGGQDDEPSAGGQGEVGADGVAHVNLFASEPNQPVAGVDVCEVSRITATSKNTSVTTPVARAALTPAGDVWVDESERALAMQKLLTGARTAHGYEPAARLGDGVEALGSPDATPSAGRIGYWTDGSHATVAATSDAGRRLVMQDLGDGMLRTNVLDKADPFGDLDADTLSDPLSNAKGKNPENDAGDSPYEAGRPMLPKDGVRAAIGGRRLIVRFTRGSAKALRAVAGRRVGASCFARPAASVFPVLLADGGVSASGTTRAPRSGGRIAIPLSRGKADVCLVVDDGTIVAIATPTATGLRWWRDLNSVLLLLAADLDHLGAAGGKTYRPTADAIAHSRKGLVAMAKAGGRAPVNRVGVWTDGAHRATVATRSASGRVFTLADEGDGMVRTNVVGEVSNLGLLLMLGGTADGGKVGTL